MGHKDDKKQQDENTEQNVQKDQNNSVLEEKLTQIQEEKHNKEQDDKEQEILVLQQKVDQLEKDKLETLEIAKKAQYEYLNLKLDFDRLQRLSAEKEKFVEQETMIKYIRKVIPVLDQLRTSLDHVKEENKDDPFVTGIKMVYDNMQKTFEGFGVKPIESLGLVPDSNFHEPLSTVPVEDENMKGKIVQVFQQGYYIENNGEKIVIATSKVVVGA